MSDAYELVDTFPFFDLNCYTKVRRRVIIYEKIIFSISHDSYYFMNPGYTNIFIKRNPNIFNIGSNNLDKYSKFLSEYAIKVNNNIVNLFEYSIKQKPELLQENFEDISNKTIQIEQSKNSKLFTVDDINNIIN